jgi:hypothetical protein
MGRVQKPSDSECYAPSSEYCYCPRNMCRNDVVQHFHTVFTLYVDVVQSLLSSHICMATQRGIIISSLIKVAGCVVHNWNLIPDGKFWHFNFTAMPKMSLRLSDLVLQVKSLKYEWPDVSIYCWV